MNKVVITGASGFLGSNLIKKLENNEDFIVYALSSKESESKATNIKSLNKKVIDSEDAEPVFKNAIVVNCAFPRNSTGTGMADGLAYIKRLFTTCKKYKAKAIINISSQSVYSQKREFPADENTEICLESPYAVGKYATELILQSICEDSDIKYTNLRMASLIGPGFDQRIVNRFVLSAINNKIIEVEINKQRFGYFDIDDAVRALQIILGSNINKWYTVYNLGTNISYSLEELAEIIRCVIQEELGLNIAIHKNETIKCGNSTLNVLRFMKDFDVNSSIDMKESVRKILAHYF